MVLPTDARPDGPGPLALVGSGEFLPGMAGVDAALLRRRPARVAVIPTAAGPEGDESVSRWFALAEAHYARLGAAVVRVDVRDRAGACDPAAVELLEGVGLVYLSGGNPRFLADALRGTPLGAAIGVRWRDGAALAGCSAGAMALGRHAVAPDGTVRPGLGLAGPIITIPHFDRPGFRERFADVLADVLAGVHPDADGHPPSPGEVVVVGIDEETAVVHDPDVGGWHVRGAGRAWLLDATGAIVDGGAGDGEPVALPAPPP